MQPCRNEAFTLCSTAGQASLNSVSSYHKLDDASIQGFECAIAIEKSFKTRAFAASGGAGQGEHESEAVSEKRNRMEGFPKPERIPDTISCAEGLLVTASIVLVLHTEVSRFR